MIDRDADVRQAGIDLDAELTGGPLAAEELRSPREPKHGPKCLLTVNGREVDLASELTPQQKIILQKCIDDMHARYGKPIGARVG